MLKYSSGVSTYCNCVIVLYGLETSGHGGPGFCTVIWGEKKCTKFTKEREMCGVLPSRSLK